MSLSVHNETLAYEEHGAGLPVVFLHGLTFDRASWRPIIDRLGGDVRSIAVDLPGHGETIAAPGSWDHNVAGIHALLEQLHVDRPVVVGHSISGGLVGTYAATYPVRGAVIVDSFPDLRPFAAFARRLEPGLRGPAFDRAFAPFQESMGFDRIPEPLRSQILARQDVRQELVLSYWDELLSTPIDQLQSRIEAELSGMTAPCLAVFGRELSDDELGYLTAHLPGVEIEQWADRGHFVHLAEVDRFAARLRAFTAAVDAGAPARTGRGALRRGA